MSSANQNVGRDELAAMLGASHASDMVAAAGTTANDLSGMGVGAAAGGAGGGSRKHHLAKDVAAEDISKMDRAQAAALVARKFAGGAATSSGAAAGATRHRATGRRKRKLQHHLLVGDLMEKGVSSVEADEEADVADYHRTGQEKEEGENFAMRAVTSGAARRKKAEAKVLMRRGGNEREQRRRSSSSDSESSDSASSSSSSDGSSQPRNRRRGRRGRNNKERRDRKSRSSSSSSSSSEDEADIRRRRARERTQKNQIEGNVPSSDLGVNQEKQDRIISDEPGKEDNAQHNQNEDDDDMSVDGKNKKEKENRTRPSQEEVPLRKRRQGGPDSRSRSESSSSSGSSSSSESSSSSDESSSDESDQNTSLVMSVSKPLYVPKSKRGTMAEVEIQQQKLEEADKRRAQEAERKAIQSRALVAEAVTAAGKNGASDDEGDEFDAGEGGVEFLSVPDDADPTEDSPDLVLAERDAWEVRELIRILCDVDGALASEKERKELGRRRALTDEERLEEDRRSGRYRAPGEARRAAGGKGDGNEKNNGGGGRFLQRFHHRGAFYMDEDTLQKAGKDDVRHRAAEYSRAATGEDKIDKSALPEVMQVKNFGFAGYSTKYKGLAKEDTTVRKQDCLPIRGAAGRGQRK